MLRYKAAGIQIVGFSDFYYEIDSETSTIRFFMLGPENEDVWFGFGVSGDYSLRGDAKMNGYALINKGTQDVFETELFALQTPRRLRNQQISCSYSWGDGFRYAICERPVILPNDINTPRRRRLGDARDFAEDLGYLFGLEDVTMIHANGMIEDNQLLPHGTKMNDRGRLHATSISSQLSVLPGLPAFEPTKAPTDC